MSKGQLHGWSGRAAERRQLGLRFDGQNQSSFRKIAGQEGAFCTEQPGQRPAG